MLAAVMLRQFSSVPRALTLSVVMLRPDNNVVVSQRCFKDDCTKEAVDCRKKPSLFPSERYSFTYDGTRVPGVPEISADMIQLLEEQSLVRFSNEAAVRHLHMAISYANMLQLVDTVGVQPMHSVLEDETLFLQNDVEQPTDNQAILRNARTLADGYFVTPPGNIPLKERSEQLDFKEIKKLMKANF